MRLSLIAMVILAGCANPNAKLVNGKSDGSIHAGGFVSQRVTGDANQVSVGKTGYKIWKRSKKISRYRHNFYVNGKEFLP